MEKYYTSERNAQIVIALLKANNIRKIIASPGATNITFVASIQQDPYFEIYSSVDERSAAYMACGLAAESGEPVVLSFEKLPSWADRSLLPEVARTGDHVDAVRRQGRASYTSGNRSQQTAQRYRSCKRFASGRKGRGRSVELRNKCQ